MSPGHGLPGVLFCVRVDGQLIRDEYAAAAMLRHHPIYNTPDSWGPDRRSPDECELFRSRHPVRPVGRLTGNVHNALVWSGVGARLVVRRWSMHRPSSTVEVVPLSGGFANAVDVASGWKEAQPVSPRVLALLEFRRHGEVAPASRAEPPVVVTDPIEEDGIVF